jgi:ribosome-associated toxin RatA of RatAB toxin-antitoxin module
VISGEQTTDVAAGAPAAYAVVADLERYPDWQEFLRSVTVRERDAAGRAALVEAQADAKVTTLRLVLRCTYEPGRRVTWRSEGGDVKSLAGAFDVQERSPDGARVSFRLDVDPGRKLGLLLRGPVADRVRDLALDGMLNDLRRRLDGPA